MSKQESDSPFEEVEVGVYCIHCKKHYSVYVDEEGWRKYRFEGQKVQFAFPNMPAEKREQLVSGLHPKCWDEIFAFAEEE